MEENRIDTPENEAGEEGNQKPVYHPRPSWQVWLARIAVVIMIVSVILYYWHIATGS